MPDLKEVLDFLPAVQFQGNCCILASLTIRDVMRRLGHQAQVRSVALHAKAALEGLPLHELGVGMNGLWKIPYEGANWDGHMVVVVDDWLIDPTFSQIKRDSWSFIPDVAVIPRLRATPSVSAKPMLRQKQTVEGLPVMAQLEIVRDDYRFLAQWLSYSRNRGWEKAPDSRPEKRRDLIEDVLKAFRYYRAEQSLL